MWFYANDTVLCWSVSTLLFSGDGRDCRAVTTHFWLSHTMQTWEWDFSFHLNLEVHFISPAFWTVFKKSKWACFPKVSPLDNHVSVFPCHMLLFTLLILQLDSSELSSQHRSVSLCLIWSLLLSTLCILAVLNFWPTSRNTTQSCPATAVLSHPATLVTVWPSRPSPPAPSLILRPQSRSRPRSGRRHAKKQRHSRQEGNLPQPSRPTWCSPDVCDLHMVGSWAGLLVTWVA